ncbi:hypothetical protein [Antribacter gilvus]|uniref:hypothetical protein n=1 Tax=Antribacter gilvus TaxID=2304675 RepID=UPI000F77FBC7|nr:hypothetical protein [Antribacter gilvus]
MTQQFEFRLQGMPLPQGEIALVDLAAIGGRLQELSTRVSRWVADIDRAGRSPSLVESAAALRLAATRPGSTILEIRAGTHDTLDLDLPFEREVTTKFWEIVTALGSDAPPADTPASVRETAVQLLDALQHAAPVVSVTRQDGAWIEFRPAEKDRTVWRVAATEPAAEPVTVVGRLEAVDLRTNRFRIVDDLGHRIALRDVEDAQNVARLIDRRVRASGLPTPDSRGRLVSISEPVLTGVTLPDLFRQHLDPSEWSPPTNYVGPDPDGGVDLDDDEWADFLFMVTGQ